MRLTPQGGFRSIPVVTLVVSLAAGPVADGPHARIPSGEARGERSPSRASSGTLPFGMGTPGCAGPHALTAKASFQMGGPSFQLTCDHAPPNSKGLLVVSKNLGSGGYDSFGPGLIVLVDLSSRPVAAIDLISDELGTVTTRVPVSRNPQLAGLSFFAQAFWVWPSDTCQPSSRGVSSSNGLSIRIP